ncbi:MAG: glycosyltransferase, partial [Planctomycetia bacterium]|nr:glycosyltransferase [Planctomycetia bacterium]
VLAFASQTETQGMVLTEAMAAGKPVVALDGPGVRDVVQDRANGRLVSIDNRQLFAHALGWIAMRTNRERTLLAMAARRTAEQFSMSRQAQRALELYQALLEASPHEGDASILSRARRRIEAEWTLLSNLAQAAGRALESEQSQTVQQS